MEDKSISGIHCVVSGKVQGVFYRASTKDKALSFNLTGWVRNLPNGDVELKAFGRADALQELVNWLWDGPAKAIVKDIDVNHISIEHFNDFTVKN